MFILKKNAKKFVYTDLMTIASVEEQRIDLKIKVPRENIRICVIDDEGFDINMLYDLGYMNIRKKIQFESIDEYKDYDIVLCDVEGIGSNVDMDRQGLVVAEQIKNVYPEKVVLLYSGKNIETFGEMPKVIDGYLRKQSSMSELAKSLDNYYRKSIDPIVVWEKTRNEMLNNKISTKTIAFLEDRYCRSLLEKKEYLYSNTDVQDIERFSIENIAKYIEVLAKVVEIVGRLHTDV